MWSRIGGLLIPMAIILVVNIVIFVMVIRQLTQSAKMSGKVYSDKEAERRETVERIQNAMAILFLLGLTWVTGYLLLIEEISQVLLHVFLFNLS